ncbi:MAG: alpha-galactosidase [Candidatus Thorarchaeota archaeon]
MASSEFCKLEVSDERIDLSNGIVMVSFNIPLGLISLTNLESGVEYFSRGYVQVHTDKQVFDSRKMTYKAFNTLDFQDERGEGKALVLKLTDPDKAAEMNIRLSVTRRVRGYNCAVQFRNKSDDISLESIDPLVIDVDSPTRIHFGNDAEKLRFFKNGFHSWELSHASPIKPGENKSHLFSVLTEMNSGSAMVLGFLTAKDQFSTVTYYGRETKKEQLAQIVASSLTDGIILSKNDGVISEELSVTFDIDSISALESYMERLAQRMAAISWDTIPVGWCSWYFYYTMPDEGEMGSNTEFLQKRFSKRIEWIQLDDGFQKTVGDWEENRRFGQGLESLVSMIHDHGYKAGIWTAPFVASEHSDIFKDRPDWFVRDDDNSPIVVGQNPLWLGNFYALDLTNPQVIEHIEKLFKRLRKFGFEYFKIDFLYHAAETGRRHDLALTRAQAIRQGLEAIRKSVGDSLILGCGAPLGPCIGITNAMRIGTDIATAWRYEWGGGVYECAVNTMSRSVMHNRLWINDPDCILVRQDDNDLTVEEVKLWLSVVALSGGILMLSDCMEEVSEDRLQLVDKLIPPYRKGARAVDGLIEPEPRIFALPIVTPFGEWAIIAAVNLSEKQIDVSFDFDKVGLDADTPHHVFDFWAQQYEGLYEKSVEISALASHTHRLFIVKPEEKVPTVLSTSMHFTQGAIEIGSMEWNSRAQELEITVIRDASQEEYLYIVFSGQWIPRSAFIEDEQKEFATVAPEVICVNYQFKKGQTIRVRFDSK